MPLFPNTYRYIAACYAHMGLFDEARATIARLRAITPQGMVNWPLRRESVLATPAFEEDERGI